MFCYENIFDEYFRFQLWRHARLMKSQHIKLQQVTDDLDKERKQREHLDEQLKQLREQFDFKEKFDRQRKEKKILL